MKSENKQKIKEEIENTLRYIYDWLIINRYPSNNPVVKLIQEMRKKNNHFCGGEKVWKPICKECKDDRK